MKKYLILIVLFFSFSISSIFAQTFHNQNIYFPSDEFSLNESNKTILDDLYSELIKYNESSIRIIGHTDQDGSIEYNMALSRNRAEEVKRYLLDKGIAEASINISYLGESDLVDHAMDEISKQKNRRVAIIAEGYSYQNVGELVSQLNPQTDELFTVDQSTESELSLRQGTEVSIPSNAFCHMDGSPLESGTVELTFKEAFEYLDMVDQQLFTQTEDRMLETGGMIYIEASQNGKPLKLQEGKSIELLLPEQELKDGMELFTGLEDENGIIWEGAGQPVSTVESNKTKFELQPIKVDLSPLLEYNLEEKERPSLNFGEMVEYPHPARKAYRPYKGNYSEEEYEEAVRKYDAVMKAYEEDQIERPEKLAHWKNEVTIRKATLYEHKEHAVRAKLINQLKENLARLEDKQDEICHKRLIGVLFNFLNNEIGRVSYDDRKYLIKTFGRGLGDVIQHDDFKMPDFRQRKGYRFFAGFYNSLMMVNKRIVENEREQRQAFLDKQIEAGVVNNSTVSRYLMTTSNLGWINCDRFYEVKEEEKMDLHFAKGSFNDKYYLVFKNIRSVVRPSRVNDAIVFMGIPKGEEVRLVAINVEDGKALLARQDFTLSSEVDVDLSFASVELKDLRKALTDI